MLTSRFHRCGRGEAPLGAMSGWHVRPCNRGTFPQRVRTIAGLVLLCASLARGDFVPGRLYIADRPVEACPSPHYANDRIWEVDPATGEANLFATIPDELCGIIYGIAFRPDGNALRTANYLYGAILEVDSDGQASVVYTVNDGLFQPGGGNGLAYNTAGDFFVSNNGAVVKFTGDIAPATVVAPGLFGPGPIAFAPNGDLYIGAQQGVFRLAPDGSLTAFSSYWVAGLAVSTLGDVYLIQPGGLYRYPQGDPQAGQFIAQLLIFGTFGTSMVLSGDESTMFVADSGRLLSVNVESGDITESQIPGSTAGSGMALYVPEPSAGLLLAGVLLTFRRARPAKR